jgi:3-isopropylmalate/(R)-2-methylmalate dehydratase small subunit
MSAPTRTGFDGRMLPFPRADVDTDQIMPQRFLKRLEKTGFGAFVFHHWRADPDFVLNRDEFSGASILLAGANFGCGSSREHAVWGLRQYGFRAVLAPSFGPIFRTNCAKNDLLALIVAGDDLDRLMALARERPDQSVRVDVDHGVVTAPGFACAVTLESSAREMWLYELDEIALTLRLADRIAEVSSRRPAWMPRLSTSPAHERAPQQ